MTEISQRKQTQLQPDLIHVHTTWLLLRNERATTITEGRDKTRRAPCSHRCPVLSPLESE